MNDIQIAHRSLPTGTSPMLNGLDRLIEEIQQEAQALRVAQFPVRQRRDQEEETEPPHTLDDLDLFVARLCQVKEWLQQDPHLLQTVDIHMNQHIKAMERRQRVQDVWQSIITTLVGALLGWLSSALASPITLWHLLFH